MNASITATNTHLNSQLTTYCSLIYKGCTIFLYFTISFKVNYQENLYYSLLTIMQMFFTIIWDTAPGYSNKNTVLTRTLVLLYQRVIFGNHVSIPIDILIQSIITSVFINLDMCFLITFTYAFLRLRTFSVKFRSMQHAAGSSNLFHADTTNTLLQKVFLHANFLKQEPH